MKKSVIILAVVGLLLAGTVSLHAAITVTEYTYEGGTAQWTTADSYVGSSSLQLDVDKDQYNPPQRAGVKFSNLGGLTVEDLSGWDYWTKSNSQFTAQPWAPYATSGVNMRLYLDTSYDNIFLGYDWGWDVILDIMPHKTSGDPATCPTPPIPADTWVNLDSLTLTPYTLWAYDEAGGEVGYVNMDTTWSDFQGLGSTSISSRTYDFSGATIQYGYLRIEGGGLITDVTAYLDDFTFDGVSVQLENGITVTSGTVIPEPGSLIVWGLLGAGAAGLGVWRRGRRVGQQPWSNENRQAIHEIITR